MRTFRDDHLVLDNQLVCSFLEKTIGPTFSISLLSISVCIEKKLVSERCHVAAREGKCELPTGTLTFSHKPCSKI